MHSPCTAEPSGALLARPCNASRRVLRLPNCVRLDAASQAAAGTAASPQPRSRAAFEGVHTPGIGLDRGPEVR
jgi:hypothetical protein